MSTPNVIMLRDSMALPQCLGNDVYVLINDTQLLDDLVTSIQQAHYNIRSFKNIQALEVACSEELPSAIIMELYIKDGNILNLESINNLTNQLGKNVPLIFISEHDNIEMRLAAARAGAHRYFCKPLNTKSVVLTLDGLTSHSQVEPYRVLFVDDDELILEYYAEVMNGTDMQVLTLSTPLECLKVLKDFKPDIVVMDVHMPGCSGIELAQVIRQDDTWGQMPIMFLSSESNLDRQLAAMNLGGDDFLSKPIEPGTLVAAINARVKRSRQIGRLTGELQQALLESKFQLTTMDQHDIVSSADVAGNIIDVNDKFCEISGFSREELLGKNHRLLKSGYHPDSFYKELWHTISKGEVWHGTICNHKKNGDEYWVESTIVPFLDEKGKPYKYVSARTDITSLRKSEERLNRSQTIADMGTWDWNIRKDSVYWSDKVKKLYGYTPELENITYEHFIKIVHPDDQVAVNNAVTACLEQGVKYNIEHRVVWPDNSVHWMLECGDVIRDKNGNPLQMLGVVQDITERKLYQQNLIKSEQQLREAQSLARIGNWQANLLTGELSWSDEIFRIFGYKPGSFIPSVDRFIATVHPDDRELVNASETRAQQTGRHDVVHRIVRPDGSIRHVHELARAECDSAGKIVRLTGTVQDITARIEIEHALIKAREHAEQASLAKSQFLSSMSHELRTPMNAIIGFSQLLKINPKYPLNDFQEDSVDEILSASQHLLSLINDVLDLAKIEEGNIELDIEDVVMSEVIFDCLQIITPMTQMRGIEITFTKNGKTVSIDGLPSFTNTVRADRARLRQALLNLLSNAIKYNSDNGKISISCQYTDNNQTRISITDTGSGLNAKQQDKLFKPFNRLGIEQSNVEGAGIGLVITKNIIEMMDGKIGVSSQPGKGSTFWFELPGGVVEIQTKNGSANQQ